MNFNCKAPCPNNIASDDLFIRIAGCLAYTKMIFLLIPLRVHDVFWHIHYPSLIPSRIRPAFSPPSHYIFAFILPFKQAFRFYKPCHLKGKVVY